MNINKIKKEILTLLSDYNNGLTAQQISQKLGYDDGKTFPQLVKVIAQLEKDHEIVINENGAIRLPIVSQEMEGIFSQNDKGFGFVKVPDLEKDIFIAEEKSGTALNGDTVLVKLTKPETPWEDKSAEGEIISVVSRQLTRLTGEFTVFDDKLKKETGYYGGLKPLNKGMDKLTCFVTDKGIHPVTGEIVVAEIDNYPQPDNKFQVDGHVIQQLGHKDAPGVDILAVLNMFDIPHTFSEEVIAQAEAVPEQIASEDIEARTDLRDELTITIDGADAKDLDDAISLKALENGNFELGVHIADVSHYATEGSPMDQEAYERGTSVYLTDRVVPMLPQRLSNGICSLHPNVDRLTLSCVMELTQDAQVKNHRIFPSVINSDFRMTYADVNAMLEDEDAQLIAKYQAIYPMLTDMQKIHERLFKMRHQRGAIDFDTDEAEIEVDKNGKPLAIHLRERGVGERLIESFMLLANETVAKHYTKKVLPFIYRIHEHPDNERLQRFLEFITTFGLMAKGSKDDMKPKYLQEILAKVSDETYGPVVKMMLLRSMQQAKYAVTPIGHYGLATDDYTHFTSPIRRYPDLIVHRLIHLYDKKKPSKAEQEKLILKLEDIADHSSQMERRSIDAERETDSLKKTEFMQDKIGMVFDGIVSSVTGFGMFIELENTVEGLVHISTIKDDYYNFVSRQLVLIGEHTGNTYHIGDRVKVKVIKADVDTREIDFELLQSDGKPMTKRKRTKKRPQKKLSTDKKHKQKTHKQKGKRKKNKKSFKIRKRKR